MKLCKILKEGARTQYSKDVYNRILNGVRYNNLTIEFKIDGEFQGVGVYVRGGWADISEDDQGIRIKWKQSLSEPEVTHIKEEVLDI